MLSHEEKRKKKKLYRCHLLAFSDGKTIYIFFLYTKNILTQKIQCFCTRQAEASSQQNYHISEHLIRGERKQKKRKSKLLFVQFVQFPSAAWGPVYWILHRTHRLCKVRGTEIGIPGRAVSTGLIWQRWKWGTTQAPKRGQALGVIFCSSHLGLGCCEYNKWFLLNFSLVFMKFPALRPCLGSHFWLPVCKNETQWLPTSEQPLPCAWENGLKFKIQISRRFKPLTKQAPSGNTTPPSLPIHF